MDELALIDTLVFKIDVVIHILKGIGSEFRELAVAIQARETPTSFEELYDKLIGYEEK